MSLFAEKRPRYHVVADTLSEAIQRGEYPVGSMLPTEAKLCEQFGFSRQTIREATRLLVELGMLSRHHGIGTRVERSAVPRAYVQRLEKVSDIWQYVEETRRSVLRVTDVVASKARVPLPGDPTQKWRMLEGLRLVADAEEPIAWTQVYVAPEYAAVTDAKNRDRVPIFSLIEKRYGVKVQRIRQEISAVAIGADVSGPLRVSARSIGLSVVREYLSTQGEVFEVTLSIHPADRYHYTMQLDLAYAGESAGEKRAAGPHDMFCVGRIPHRHTRSPVMPTRRTFIKTSAALGLGSLSSLPLGAMSAPRDETRREPRDVGRASAPLNILILGGTGFTGPEQVDYAIARGHRVTLFNRNQTRPGLFKGKVAEELIGDLNNDTSALQGKKFDVVLDNPTTFPAWVRNAAKHLAGNVKHYVFISTTSTYSDESIIGINENSPVHSMPADIDPYTLDPAHAGRYYGPLKVRAEQEVAKQYPDMWTVIRPCLIVGPLDRTDRFTYWPARIDKGGEVLAPDKPDDPCQFIDSRDLAEWMVRIAENRVLGTYNAVGPANPMTVAEMLYGVKAITTAGAHFTWVPWDFLQAEKIRPWRNMTVWQPPYGATAGYQRRNASKAIAAGLTFRPLAVTAKDTLDWHRTRPQKEQDATLNGEINGLAMTREAEVLAAWKAKQAAGGDD